MNLIVEGMTCDHCARTVTQAIHALDSSAEVDVDLEDGSVRIIGSILAEDAVNSITQGGYTVVAVLDPEAEASPVAASAKPCCGSCHV